MKTATLLSLHFNATDPTALFTRAFEHLNATIVAQKQYDNTYDFRFFHNGKKIITGIPEDAIIHLISYLTDLENCARELQNLENLLKPLINKYTNDTLRKVSGK